MELPFLRDIAVIFGLSIAILFLCHRLHVPTVVAFLLTGILVGPHGLGLIDAVHEVENLAEVGIVLLLFTIGMEFSFKDLSQVKRSVVVGGSLQVLLTFLAGFLIALGLGRPASQSVLIGFLISLSSTAIVLKLFQERAEIDSPHGRASLGILIFQDLTIVPMMLLVPLLAGISNNIGASLLMLVFKAMAIILLVIVSAKWVMPNLLYQIAKTQNRELFLFSIIAIGIIVAWLTSSAGLSLALGAFLAGLIISESEYSHHALGNMLPFRDVFTSFFFISVGMLLDINFILRQPQLIILIAFGTLLLKAILAGSVATILGFSIRTAILIGFAVSQIGEFSFILSKAGVDYGLLSRSAYQLFLAVSVLTMASAPLAIAVAPRVADGIARLPMPNRLRFGCNPVKHVKQPGRKDHLVIIGFGFNGKNLARAASAANIPYQVIEMNAEVVRDEQYKGEPICYGDATHEAVLEHADIRDARVAVVAISDPAATRRIIATIRSLNPNIYIIVRTRYIQELELLHELGANEVIPEEFETSVEIFARVLKKYLIPRDEIEEFVSEIRSDGYEMLRSLSKKKASYSDFKLHLPEIEISTLRIGERAAAAGKTLAQIELRKKYGVSMLAIRRESDMLSNPHGETKLEAGDIVVIVGMRDNIFRAESLFRNLE
ncbi:MAG: cation:proton antiporter [Firmicutes bacterium]|nr:cation:proton antiporter [Bacillota bacterium]